MRKNKCYGCTERSQTCHGTCESYLAYAKECETIRNNRMSDYVYQGYLKQCNDKACRIHYGKGNR